MMLFLSVVHANPGMAWTQAKSVPAKPAASTPASSSTSTVPSFQSSGTGGASLPLTGSGTQTGTAGFYAGTNLPATGTTVSPGVTSSAKATISTYVVRVRTSIVGLPSGGQDQQKSLASQSGTRTSQQTGIAGSGPGSIPAPSTSTTFQYPSAGNSVPRPAQVPGGTQSASDPQAHASLTSPADSGKNFLELLDRNAKWSSATSKPAAPGQPIQVKLVGATVAAVIHLVPSENQNGGLDIIASAQVWIQEPDGSIQSRTTMSLLTVTLSERMFFFPLGYSADGNSPLILEIVVDKASR